MKRWWRVALVVVATASAIGWSAETAGAETPHGVARPAAPTVGQPPAPATQGSGDESETEPESQPGSETPGTGDADNEFLPEERDLSDCIGALERPGCGSDARGGWRQTAIFALLVVVLGVGAWRIVVVVRRRDRAMMASADANRTSRGDGSPTPPTSTSSRPDSGQDDPDAG